jgi:hypothetical protein
MGANQRGVIRIRKQADPLGDELPLGLSLGLSLKLSLKRRT